jgi:hypothetical protein
MLNEHFVIVGVIINLIGGLGYIFDTLKGKTKPNRVTWFIWAIAPLIAFAAEIKQGVGIESLLTFIVGFNPLLIFIASFINKNARWNLGKLDIICGILALGGLGLWYITRVGNIAILFSILADFLAAIPTIIKSYQYPETESYKEFLGVIIAAALTLLTITTWNFSSIGFPLYAFSLCSVLFLLVKFKLGKKITQLMRKYTLPQTNQA